MNIEITLKNYRCFPDSKPVRISLRPGLSAYIGVNHVGKSTLLRFFYEFRGLFRVLTDPVQLTQALTGVRAFDKADSVLDLHEVFCNLNDRGIEIEFHMQGNDPHSEPSDPPAVKRVVIKVPRGTNQCSATAYLSDRAESQLDFQGISLDADGVLKREGIPVATLSLLNAMFSSLSECLYIGAFRNAINVGTNLKYFDIQVGQSFIESWRELKTGDRKSLNEIAHKLELEIGRIFGFTDLQINPSTNNQTLQLFIGEKSYRLSEVGSGIAQFIIVLISAAVRRPSFILIDEPELSLHASLQLDFLTALTSYASEGTLFATHSMGLARAGGDWIYSIVRDATDTASVQPYEATPHLSEFLGELNFSGYRDLGSETILLVEGATDIKTVQQFLRLYRREHSVVILPLGGSTMINADREAELGEVRRLSDSVFALVDSEREGESSPVDTTRLAFADMCKAVGIQCHVLELRAIENYLSEQAIQRVKGPKYRALDHYESLRDLEFGWAKEENWRIAREMTREEVDQTDLGMFLASL